jgi:hypothetical protein
MEAEQVETEVTAEERAEMWEAISEGNEPSEPQEDVSTEANGEESPVVEDPWAAVPHAIRESFDSMAAKVESFDAMASRLKQAESRIGALQNKLTQAAPPEPTPEEKRRAAEDEMKWQTLKEDFPEWADEMERRFAKTDNALKVQREQHEQTENMLRREVKEMEDNLALRIEKSSLAQKYPDWEEIVRMEEYQQWLEVQPPEIKRKTGSEFAKDAISVLDKFAKEKLHKSPASIAEERKQRLSAAVLVNGFSAKASKSERDMTEDEYRESLASELWPGSKK